MSDGPQTAPDYAAIIAKRLDSIELQMERLIEMHTVSYRDGAARLDQIEEKLDQLILRAGLR
jgi:tetrahydromethanopterin S-methyltransferase subunit G